MDSNPGTLLHYQACLCVEFFKYLYLTLLCLFFVVVGIIEMGVARATSPTTYLRPWSAIMWC